MLNLYHTYTDEDVVLLIPKKNNDKIKVIKESEFEINGETERENLIFAYCPVYGIINNGYRHLYEKRVNDDLSNLVVKYNNEGEFMEIGITASEECIPIYMYYTVDKVRYDMQWIIDKCTEYFSEYLTEKFKDIQICRVWLYQLYDGEAVQINLTVGTEEERKRLEEKNEDINHLGNYSTHINLIEILEHKLATLILSIRKDQLADENELFQYIVSEINYRLHEGYWKHEVNVSPDFTFYNIQAD